MTVNQTVCGTDLTQDGTLGIHCPACGMMNNKQAVFCSNPVCHKALGEFSFVREEIESEKRWHEAVAEKAISFVGKPHFFAAQAVSIAFWVALNTGLIAMGIQFDAYPFGLLSLLLSIEAIFITGFVLISENRQTAYADKRAELDYEVSVRTYRQLLETDAHLHHLSERLTHLERLLSERTEETGKNPT